MLITRDAWALLTSAPLVIESSRTTFCYAGAPVEASQKMRRYLHLMRYTAPEEQASTLVDES